MLFQLSKTTVLVAGLSIALSLLGAQAAQAAQFFDFTTTYTDGSVGTGSFSIDGAPTNADSFDDYSYESWSPVSDLTYTYLGQTYTDFAYSYFVSYEIPGSGPLVDFNGNSAQGLFFYTDDTYNISVEIFDAANNSADYGYGSTDDTGIALIMTSVAITERTTETQSVPEPGTIAGLALTGVGFLATRRKQRNSTAPVLEKVCS